MPFVGPRPIVAGREWFLPRLQLTTRSLLLMSSAKAYSACSYDEDQWLTARSSNQGFVQAAL
jgi:hypothetical protein